MKRFAFTFIGKDRPGIVAAVTQFLYRAGGNVEDATMTILEGQFAMILVATLPSLSAEQRLEKGFFHLRKKWRLNHFSQPLPADLTRGEKHPKGMKTCLLSVMGKDRTGIVYETSKILAKHGLNITDLNSQILGEGKKALFAMMIEFDVPARINLKRLDSAWKGLEERVGVEVRLRPLERLSL